MVSFRFFIESLMVCSLLLLWFVCLAGIKTKKLRTALTILLRWKWYDNEMMIMLISWDDDVLSVTDKNNMIGTQYSSVVDWHSGKKYSINTTTIKSNGPSFLRFLFFIWCWTELDISKENKKLSKISVKCILSVSFFMQGVNCIGHATPILVCYFLAQIILLMWLGM